MAHEITLSLARSGLTLTATLMQGTTVAASGIAMPETAVPGDYVGTVPTNTPAGRYRVLALFGGVVMGSGELVWDGAAELPAPPPAPSDIGLCRLYGYLETPDNRRLVNAKVSIELMPRDTPIASERLIADRVVELTTDSEGRIVGPASTTYVDLQRNDLLLPAGTWYEVTSVKLGVHRKRVQLTTTTADLRQLLLAST